MERLDRQDSYGTVVVVACTVLAVLSFLDHEDNGWLAMLAMLAALATTLLPGGLATVRAIRSPPHCYLITSLLLGGALVAGLLRQDSSTFGGLASALALLYLLTLGVARLQKARSRRPH